MGIERFEPGGDPRRVGPCHDIHTAVCAADDPAGPRMSRPVFDGWLAMGWTGDPREAWLVRGADGTVAGWYLLQLPDKENRHLAMITLLVDPARRRHGFGTALVRHAAERALAGGRTLLTGYAWQDAPGERFARSLGATAGLAEVRRRLDLAAVSAGLMAALRAEADAAAAGYTLIWWAPPTPEEYLDQVAAIENALSDAPRDPSWEGQVWDAERVRVADRMTELMGVRAYTVAARHDATGDLAGYTRVVVPPEEPPWAFQGLTAVVRAHRGHRLGLLLKLAMLERLLEAEPERRWLLTGNAATNEHMIAINEALGYQVFGPPEVSFEIPPEKVLQAT